MTQRKGEFEACFADGLDLSELTSVAATEPTAATKTPPDNNNNNKSLSHSANLLRIKQVEAAMKLQNEQEEIVLQSLITFRSEQLKQEVSNQKVEIPKLPAPTDSQVAPPLHISKNADGAATLGGSTVSISSSSSNMIHNVLVSMHDESIRKGLDNMPRKMLMKRNTKNTKKSIAKKTMKRKF
jgi:hypothetical protein